ncbi:MAG: Rpp14/Pop5 family protein [Candidatus Nanoarchaeia archaeon]
MREKKRYLAFEIISDENLSRYAVLKALKQKIIQMLGVFGSANAGVIFLQDKYIPEKQAGILRVNHNYLDKVKASFCFITKIENKSVIVRSLGASGMLNKAVEYIKVNNCEVNKQCNQ